jgi:c-di-GMP-binding flagellar brake protein YcgR
VNKVIYMTDRAPEPSAQKSGIRDKRYSIRYPFAAEAELIDLESGKQITGVTSDISLGGCFICTSKAVPLNTRARLKLSRHGQSFEALVLVRMVKPRIGLGIEFFDLEQTNHQILSNWIESLRRKR